MFLFLFQKCSAVSRASFWTSVLVLWPNPIPQGTPLPDLPVSTMQESPSTLSHQRCHSLAKSSIFRQTNLDLCNPKKTPPRPKGANKPNTGDNVSATNHRGLFGVGLITSGRGRDVEILTFSIPTPTHAQGKATWAEEAAVWSRDWELQRAQEVRGSNLPLVQRALGKLSRAGLGTAELEALPDTNQHPVLSHLPKCNQMGHSSIQVLMLQIHQTLYFLTEGLLQPLQ